MGSRVVFYRLAAKFVDSEENIPEDARDILYYTLAVGHHTGVMDCFAPRVFCTPETYRCVVEMLPTGDARYKLEGMMRFGEIQIDKSHVPLLKPILTKTLGMLYVKKDTNPYSSEILWLTNFLELLDEVEVEDAVYVVGRYEETPRGGGVS